MFLCLQVPRNHENPKITGSTFTFRKIRYWFVLFEVEIQLMCWHSGYQLNLQVFADFGEQ